MNRITYDNSKGSFAELHNVDEKIQLQLLNQMKFVEQLEMR